VRDVALECDQRDQDHQAEREQPPVSWRVPQPSAQRGSPDARATRSQVQSGHAVIASRHVLEGENDAFAAARHRAAGTIRYWGVPRAAGTIRYWGVPLAAAVEKRRHRGGAMGLPSHPDPKRRDRVLPPPAKARYGVSQRRKLGRLDDEAAAPLTVWRVRVRAPFGAGGRRSASAAETRGCFGAVSE